MLIERVGDWRAGRAGRKTEMGATATARLRQGIAELLRQRFPFLTVEAGERLLHDLTRDVGLALPREVLAGRFESGRLRVDATNLEGSAVAEIVVRYDAALVLRGRPYGGADALGARGAVEPRSVLKTGGTRGGSPAGRGYGRVILLV